MSFRDEIKDYTIDDLKLIITDQQSLYSAEELEQLQDLLKEKLRMRDEEQRIREKEKQEKILERLPKIIICPKCDGPNAFTNKECEFCKAKLDKEAYYREAAIEPPEEDEFEEEQKNYQKNKTAEHENRYTFHHVISFLIPMVGFILGAVMLANDDEEKSSAGKWCIILGLIGIFSVGVLSGILLGVSMW